MPYATEDNTCTGYQYGARGENDINLYIISTLPDGRISDVCGWLEPVDAENPTGDLYIHMGSAVDPGWILDTDYDTFSVTYSCENHPLELTHKKTASIDTRDPNPSQETVSITSLTNLAAICTCYRSRSTKHSRHLRATV